MRYSPEAPSQLHDLRIEPHEMLGNADADESQFIFREAQAGRSSVFNRLSRIARPAQRECYAGLGNRPCNHDLRNRRPMRFGHRLQTPRQPRDLLAVCG